METRVDFLVRRLANGGMERMVLEHAEAVRRLGAHPRVLCLEDPGPMAEAARARDLEVQALGLPASAPGAALGALPALVGRLRAAPPALLVTHQRRCGLLGGLAARWTRVPCAVALHNLDPPPPPGLAWLERGLDRRRRFLAVSLAVRRHALAGRGLRPEQVLLAPNPLPVTEAAPAPSPGGEATVLFLGKLEAKKGPDRFLELAAWLAPRAPGLRFQVAGDGPMRRALEAEARARGVDFEWLGAVPEGAPHLARAALAVFPSRREGFGLAIAEALGAGTPVLLSDLAPLREVYGRLGPAAFVPEEAPPRTWADRALAWLEDPRARARVTRAWGEILRARPPQEARQRIERAYQDLLDWAASTGAWPATAEGPLRARRARAAAPPCAGRGGA